MIIVKHEHMRDLGYCNKGGRQFFERHNLDWGKFLREGVDAETLIKTGDAMALRAVAHAEEKQ